MPDAGFSSLSLPDSSRVPWNFRERKKIQKEKKQSGDSVLLKQGDILLFNQEGENRTRMIIFFQVSLGGINFT